LLKLNPINMKEYIIECNESLRAFIDGGHVLQSEKEKLIQLSKLCKFSEESIAVTVKDSMITNFAYLTKK
jgi:hypothetical protein